MNTASLPHNLKPRGKQCQRLVVYIAILNGLMIPAIIFSSLLSHNIEYVLSLIHGDGLSSEEENFSYMYRYVQLHASSWPTSVTDFTSSLNCWANLIFSTFIWNFSPEKWIKEDCVWLKNEQEAHKPNQSQPGTDLSA